MIRQIVEGNYFVCVTGKPCTRLFAFIYVCASLNFPSLFNLPCSEMFSFMLHSTHRHAPKNGGPERGCFLGRRPRRRREYQPKTLL